MTKFTSWVELNNFFKLFSENAGDSLANVLTDCAIELDLSEDQIKQIMGQSHQGIHLLVKFFEHEKGSQAFRDFLKKELLIGLEPE